MGEALLELDWAAYADEIGRRVDTVRRSQGVSQTELAAVTGLSRTQIQNIERSRSFPKAGTKNESKKATNKKGKKTGKKGNKKNPKNQTPGNTSLHSVFLIAQALGVPPKMLIPEGIPQGDYRAKLDETWSAIEFDIAKDISQMPLPPTTRTSQFVKPPVNPLNWVEELQPAQAKPERTPPAQQPVKNLLRPPQPKRPRMIPVHYDENNRRIPN